MDDSYHRRIISFFLHIESVEIIYIQWFCIRIYSFSNNESWIPNKKKISEPREKDEKRLRFKIDMVEKNFASSPQNVREILAVIFPVVNRSIYTWFISIG